ncbi:prolipoprotein diacylglyceryl transferase family protein, partial [Vibrio parahaemolyticus]
SHAVHPVQIYDAFGDIALAAVVYAFSRYFARREGQTFFLFYICYSVSRFTSEHFRGDHGHFTWFAGYPFTVSQLV